MSHFTKVRTALTDQDRLVAVLRELGFPEVESHATPTHLYGWKGDRRSQKAEVVVRRAYVGAASNDIGFCRTPDGTFEAIISEYDRSTYNKTWLHKLAQQYGRMTALAYAEANGLDIAAEEIDQRTGEVRLILRRGSYGRN